MKGIDTICGHIGMHLQLLRYAKRALAMTEDCCWPSRGVTFDDQPGAASKLDMFVPQQLYGSPVRMVQQAFTRSIGQARHASLSAICTRCMAEQGLRIRLVPGEPQQFSRALLPPP